MLIPLVPPRVKEGHQRARVRIKAGDIWTLEQVAAAAAESQIIYYCLSTVLPRDDVVEKGVPWIAES